MVPIERRTLQRELVCALRGVAARGYACRVKTTNGTWRNTPQQSLRAGGECHRILSNEHWQRAAAANPPQPIKHRAKQQQDRQRAHRPSRKWLRQDFRHPLPDREERSGRDEEREAHAPQMARKALSTARRAESQDAHVADRPEEQDGGDDEGHHTDRGAVRYADGRKARAVEGLDAAHDRAERESERQRQRDGIDPTSPPRGGADRRQSRADEVERQEAYHYVSVGQTTFAEPQNGGAGAHDEHGVHEQQPTAAVDRPALLHRESDGAKNNREPACGNVGWEEHGLP